MKTAPFRLTGGRVLAILLAFFLLIVIANAFLITLAVRSFPGEQEKKSYLQGLAFNELIAERERQQALGWTAEFSRSSRDDGAFTLAFTNAAGAPISGLDVTGALARPADDNADIALAFTETAPGVYQATIDEAAAGAWRLSAVATSARGERFELEKRLTLE